MKIIKNQKNFKVKALLEMANPKTAMLDAFWDTMNDILNSEGIDRIKTSYSYLCSAHHKDNIQQDPDANFKKLLRAFDEEGWDSVTLSAIFNKHGEAIAEKYNDYDYGSLPFSPSGMVDYFLFKMTKGKVILMGYETPAIESNLTPGDEAFFKFHYGYNKTPYGKLAMEQHFGSLDKFYDSLGNNFVNFLKLETAKKYDISFDAAIFMTMVSENYNTDDISQYYDYDNGTNIGTLDLKAAGVNVDNDKEVLGEWLNSLGLPLKGSPDDAYSAGGYSELNDGIVKLYFGS